MAHSYTCQLVHIVFSTQERRRLIAEEIREDILRYMTGVVRNLGSSVIRTNAVEDHAHVLAALKPSMALSDLIGKMKSNTSRFVHESWPSRREFEWQHGYGAFSVSPSRKEAVIAYIDNQQQHHERESFEDEFRALLTAHGIEYDEKYVFG